MMLDVLDDSFDVGLFVKLDDGIEHALDEGEDWLANSSRPTSASLRTRSVPRQSN